MLLPSVAQPEGEREGRTAVGNTVIPRLHDRANIELAQRAMVISMLIMREGGL